MLETHLEGKNLQEEAKLYTMIYRENRRAPTLPGTRS
jgi:hypothetical protein